MLLILFAIGQLFPSKVFLGPTATRQKVNKYYGPPALAGFLGLMVFAPSESPTVSAGAPTTTMTPSSKAADGIAAPIEPVLSVVPEEKGRFLPVNFEGYMLPGRIGDAKAAGFKECEASYSGYSCTRQEPARGFMIRCARASEP